MIYIVAIIASFANAYWFAHIGLDGLIIPCIATGHVACVVIWEIRRTKKFLLEQQKIMLEQQKQEILAELLKASSDELPKIE